MFEKSVESNNVSGKFHDEQKHSRKLTKQIRRWKKQCKDKRYRLRLRQSKLRNKWQINVYVWLKPNLCLTFLLFESVDFAYFVKRIWLFLSHSHLLNVPLNTIYAIVHFRFRHWTRCMRDKFQVSRPLWTVCDDLNNFGTMPWT